MKSHRVRMRHLRCFLAVANTGSVTRAAESLGTVQPSVSRSLRELEEELGGPLFERTSFGLALNEKGRLLHSYVNGGMGQIDLGLKAIRGGLAEQRVGVYVLPNVVRTIMPGAVARFKSLYPAIDVTLKATTGGGLQRYIHTGDVDFGFGRLLAADHMKGLNFEHLFNEPLVFFVRNGHPLIGQKTVGVDDIDRFPVVLPLPKTIIRAEIDRCIIAHGLSRFSNLIETLSFEFARNYITISDAVVCQPLGAMRRELADGSVKALEFGTDDLIGAVGLTTLAGQPISEPAQLLMQVIREEVDIQGLSDDRI